MSKLKRVFTILMCILLTLPMCLVSKPNNVYAATTYTRTLIENGSLLQSKYFVISPEYGERTPYLKWGVTGKYGNYPLDGTISEAVSLMGVDTVDIYFITNARNANGSYPYINNITYNYGLKDENGNVVLSPSSTDVFYSTQTQLYAKNVYKYGQEWHSYAPSFQELLLKCHNLNVTEASLTREKGGTSLGGEYHWVVRMTIPQELKNGKKYYPFFEGHRNDDTIVSTSGEVEGGSATWKLTSEAKIESNTKYLPTGSPFVFNGTSSPHACTPVADGNYEATCTEDGLAGRTICSDCGSIVTDGTVIPATGHTFQTLIINSQKVAERCIKCGFLGSGNLTRLKISTF